MSHTGIPSSRHINRRQFLRGSAVAAGAAVAIPAIVPSSVFGAAAPSERITMECIGVGNMGSSDLKAFTGNSGSQVVAVCEVDAQRLVEAREMAGIDAGSCYKDFRELLARTDIDAVTVVTPDHWHVPICIAAARAGKDVYCEKPLTLVILEGRQLVNEVKRYGRILQTGSQQRSSDNFRKACELVRNGYIGDVKTVIVGEGEFPQTGLFTTATKIYFEATYANGTKLICKTGGSNTRFEGTKGWVDVKHGGLKTQPESLATQVIGPQEIPLYDSKNHHQNFLDCIQSRQEPIAGAEVGHRSSTLCHPGNMAMLLKRPLKWDPAKEEFMGDDVAKRMRRRPQRAPWNV